MRHSGSCAGVLEQNRHALDPAKSHRAAARVEGFRLAQSAGARIATDPPWKPIASVSEAVPALADFRFVGDNQNRNL